MHSALPRFGGALGRIAAFAFLVVLFTSILLPVFRWLHGSLFHPFVQANLTLGILAALLAALASSALLMRLLEGGTLAGLGIGWDRDGRWNALLGVLGGVASACLVTALPVVFGAAALRPVESGEADLRNFIFYLVVLVLGAVSEEVQTRGYPFQILIRAAGPVPAILIGASLFAAAHRNNPAATLPGIVNTFLAGAVLGCAFWRSGELWLPIGLHAGWNLMLPVFGANLSGFHLRLTRYEMEWRIPVLWSGGEYGPEAGLLTTFAFLFWLVYIWKAPVRRRTPWLLNSEVPKLAPQQAPAAPDSGRAE